MPEHKPPRSPPPTYDSPLVRVVPEAKRNIIVRDAVAAAPVLAVNALIPSFDKMRLFTPPARGPNVPGIAKRPSETPTVPQPKTPTVSFDHSELIGGLGWGPIYPFIIQTAAVWQEIIERCGGPKDADVKRYIEMYVGDMVHYHIHESSSERSTILLHQIRIHGPRKIAERIVQDLKAKSQSYQVTGVIVPSWLHEEVKNLKEGGLLALKKETGASLLFHNSPHHIYNIPSNGAELRSCERESVVKIVGSVQVCILVKDEIEVR